MRIWQTHASRRRAAGAAAAALLAVTWQLTIFNRSVVFMDEGQMAAIASRLLGGETLYRDIYTGVFPGAYYLAALLFAVFGEDLVVLRAAQVVVNSATAALLFCIAARAVRLRFAFLAPVLYLILVFVGFPGLSMWNYSSLSMGLAVATLYFLSSYAAEERRIDLLYAGIAAGLAVVFKQNFGIYAAVALVIAVATLPGERPRTARALWRRLWPIAAGGSGVIVAMLLALASVGALPAFVDATFLTLFSTQLAAFNNPIPSLIGSLPVSDGRFSFLYLPPSFFAYLIRGEAVLGRGITPLARVLAIKVSYWTPILVLLVTPALVYLARRRTHRSQNRVATVACVFAPIMFLGIFPSAIWSHLGFVLAPVAILAAVAVDRIDRLLARARFARALWEGGSAAAAATCLIISAAISGDIQRWYSEDLDLPRAALLVSARERALLRGATEFIAQETIPGDPIFVAPDMPILYFITGRQNPTPYDLLIPGNVKEDVILSRLRSSQPLCAVFNPSMYIEFPAFDILFPRVERYLRTHYETESTVGAEGTEWECLMRRREGDVESEP